MLAQIINASSRPGDVVADFFMESGSTLKAAMKLGRRVMGVKLERENFLQTAIEMKAYIGTAFNLTRKMM